MKNLTICFLILLPLLLSCAPRELPHAYPPAWDERIPLDADSSKTTSLSSTLSDLLSEDNNHYHFRKVRWGFTQERVELAEAGNRVHQRTENELVYRHRINGVYCKLVYTFKDNKLRTAGYMTDKPIRDADNLIREAIDKHGEPTGETGGYVWKIPDTVIYANVYASTAKSTVTKYEYSSGGLLQGLIKPKEEKAGHIFYFDGVFAYVDRAFFDQLHEVNFPLDELSFYEKQLMGVIERRKRQIIPGVGTIPQ